MTPKQSQSKSHVEFKKLNFQARKSAGPAYEQVHVGVEINVNDENTEIDVLQPVKTLAFDQETKEVTADNVAMSGSVAGSLGILNPMPTMSLSGSSSREHLPVRNPKNIIHGSQRNILMELCHGDSPLMIQTNERVGLDLGGLTVPFQVWISNFVASRILGCHHPHLNILMSSLHHAGL